VIDHDPSLGWSLGRVLLDSHLLHTLYYQLPLFTCLYVACLIPFTVRHSEPGALVLFLSFPRFLLLQVLGGVLLANSRVGSILTDTFVESIQGLLVVLLLGCSLLLARTGTGHVHLKKGRWRSG
jgi:hypothetical protein